MVSITAGSLCGRGGSKQEAPCQDQEAENLPLSHKHKESKLEVGLGKDLPKQLSKQHQHQKQMPEFKMPDSVGDISNPCTMSPRPFRINIIPSHVDFTGGSKRGSPLVLTGSLENNMKAIILGQVNTSTISSSPSSPFVSSYPSHDTRD